MAAVAAGASVVSRVPSSIVGSAGLVDDGVISASAVVSPKSSKRQNLRISVGALLSGGVGGKWPSLSPLSSPSPRRSLRGLNVRAEAVNGDESKSIAPLEPESATGQFLVSVLKSHPHLFSAAAEQQLERLAADREAAGKQESGQSGTDLILYKRIADLKAEERRKSVEEIIYALIVQKFVDGGVSLVRTLPSISDSNTRDVEITPAQEKQLEAVHSAEALEMVREHLAVVLGGRGASTFLDQHTIAHISKLRVGQVYAASIMYGYFLRRVDQRFQLEKTMKALDKGFGELLEADVFQMTEDDRVDESAAGRDPLAAEAAAAIANLNASEAVKQGFGPGVLPGGMKPSKLRSYVMSFEPETLHRCATMRAKESLNVIEKHAEALFGKPEIRVAPDGSFTVVSDDTIRVSFAGLRRLVLEAVAFGSFLWDVESYVDSQYSLIARQ
ncbi:hypothetical protein R1flu_021590 [Riccia fluitans]|uniref:Uncharacterized protein n=1 Tax=Riccia fluitans TaxID=41844 RepID=A0ABD1ZPU7_9MARC